MDDVVVRRTHLVGQVPSEAMPVARGYDRADQAAAFAVPPVCRVPTGSAVDRLTGRDRGL